MKKIALSIALSAALVGCMGAEERSDAPNIDPNTYDVTTFADGLNKPWGLVFLDESTALVTEISGQIRLIENGTVSEPLTGGPEVYANGQGGLLDLVLAPDFEESGTLFISYSKGDDARNATAIARAQFDGEALIGLEDIFVASPWRDTPSHFGGRMVILPDNTLLLTLGDAFAYREEAQVRENHLGSLIRMNLDGSVPDNNPFADEDGPAALVYSYGHRNVQGIAYDAARDIIWEHEHGPQGGDELNKIVPAANYGWPIVTEGIDYNGARISPYSDHKGFEAPTYVWTPSIAPGGLAIYTGSAFEDWTGDLFVAGLASQALHHIDVDEAGNVVGENRLLYELDERIRQVVEGPDEALYVLIDGEEGSVLRIAPAR
jgi:glucose/arabinose dehydrogenase